MIAKAIDFHKAALARIARKRAIPLSYKVLGSWTTEHLQYTAEGYKLMREQEEQEKIDADRRDFEERTITHKYGDSENEEAPPAEDVKMPQMEGEDFGEKTPVYEIEEVEPTFGLRSLPGNYELRGRMPELEPASESSGEERDVSDSETKLIVNSLMIPPGTRYRSGVAPPFEPSSNWRFHRFNPNCKDGGPRYLPGYWEKQ